MPFVIHNKHIISTALGTPPFEPTFTIPAIISPPVQTVPKTVFANGFNVVTVSDSYLTHKTPPPDPVVHTTPLVLTMKNNVYANGLEIAVFGGKLTACAVKLTPVLPCNVFIGGPNPV